MDLVQWVDEHLDRTFDRLERAAAPIWEAQVRATQSLVTVSGGALVLSVSLVQWIGPGLASAHWKFLLPVSWALFAWTIMLGIGKIGQMSLARGQRMRLEVKRGEIRAKVRAVQEEPDAGEKIDAILAAAMEEAGAEPTKAIQTHDRIAKLMGWTFLLALLALVAFTIRNAPL
jgi:hypothetical protein